MILDRIREGGPGAYLAILAGLLGLLLGGISVLSLLARNRSSFALGTVTLVVAMGAAGAGMLGTVWGRSQVTNALAFVDSDVDKEHLMRVGFRESQSASWVGLFAALVPLVLGAAAAIGGSRLQQPKTRAQAFGDPMASADDGLGGQTVVAFIFTAIGVVAVGGAWAMAHSELPKLRYAFDEEDQDSWALARAIEDVSRDRKEACRDLGGAIERFWEPEDRKEWPRKLRRPIAPSLEAWRGAADGCAKKLIEELDADQDVTQAALLESPLLHDEALRAQVLAWKPKTAEAPEDPKEEDSRPPGVLGILGAVNKPGGSLEASVIRAVVQRNLNAIRLCYERELTKSPTLEGKVLVNFTIDASGRVAIASDASPEPFPNAKVPACVLTRFKAMQFPKPTGGGMVTVKYPVVFKAAQ